MNRVDCINKNDRYNPYERITHIGGMNAEGERFWITQQEAIDGIVSSRWSFYVERPPGDRVDIEVAVSPYGNRYIKTVPDSDAPNNLLSLPECV